MSDQDDLDRDYRALYDNTYLRAWDLPPGHDIVLTIERVKGEEIQGKEKDKYRRPVVFFKGKKKGLVLNKGMGKAISGMYGRFMKSWVGKQIAIFTTQERAFGEVHDVIRVRPVVPKGKGRSPGQPAPAQLPPGDVADAEFEDAAPEGQEVAR